MRSLAILLPLVLIGCADTIRNTIHENAVANCTASRHCTVSDDGTGHGPPQQAAIDPPRRD